MTTDPTATVLTAPLSAAIDADLAAELVAAPATVTPLVHVDALQVAEGSGWVPAADLEGSGRLWTRGGMPAVAGEFRIDYGSAVGQALLTDTLLAELLGSWPFDGVHLAGLLSGRGEPGYDPPEGDPAHLAHGGAYRSTGIRAAVAATRALSNPIPDLTSDGIREPLVDTVDLVTEGDGWLPGHGELAEEDLLALGVSDVDLVARHMSPPLAAIVYHETAQAGRLVQPFTRATRSDSLHHPYAGWTGLTDDEWNQLLAFQVATVGIAGHLPLLPLPLEHYNDRLDPDAAEPHCVRFARKIFAALRDTTWCAQFLGFGRMETPLVHVAARTVTTNPLSWAKKISPRIWDACGIPGVPRYRAGGGWSDGWSDGWATGPETPTTGAGAVHVDFDVPCVLASFWRDPGTTDLGLILANWTNASAAWQGTFGLSRYAGWGNPGMFSDGWSDGWYRGPRYRIDELRGEGSAWSDGWSDGWGGGPPSEVEIASDLRAAISVECSGTAGTRTDQTIFLGAMPPYSVHAYRFRQE